jgi:hypothetical protein
MAGWPRRWVILASAFRNVSEHFEAFRNKPLPLVAFCWELTWAACIGRRTETKVGPVGRRSHYYRGRRGETKAAATDQHGCPLFACRTYFTTHEAVKAPRPRSDAPPARP